jgi:hypothetical protein
MKDRRETLKIVGAIGSTCAFPFAANELYAQHAGHTPPKPPQTPSTPSFFTPEEFALISRLADLIIPATSTPGALAAEVPMYMDTVVSKNPAAQRTLRAGLASFTLACRARHGKTFLELDEAAQIAELTPLCEAADQGNIRQPEVAMFKAVKSMTADGYYTSKIGLIDELGYRGNSVLSEFPTCTHEH